MSVNDCAYYMILYLYSVNTVHRQCVYVHERVLHILNISSVSGKYTVSFSHPMDDVCFSVFPADHLATCIYHVLSPPIHIHIHYVYLISGRRGLGIT